MQSYYKLTEIYATDVKHFFGSLRLQYFGHEGEKDNLLFQMNGRVKQILYFWKGCANSHRRGVWFCTYHMYTYISQRSRGQIIKKSETSLKLKPPNAHNTQTYWVPSMSIWNERVFSHFFFFFLSCNWQKLKYYIDYLIQLGAGFVWAVLNVNLKEM